MASIKVKPIRRFSQLIQPPGDKSISHRAILLGALASGDYTVSNFLPGEDCRNSIGAMRALGVDIEMTDETSCLVHGKGGKLVESDDPVDCGNSGTTMRLLSGIVASQPFTTRLFGDSSLNERPMRRIADPLELMGAKVETRGDKGCPPLKIVGGTLKGIRYPLPVASAQVKSCVLLAGLRAEGKTIIEEKIQTRDHTERMLKYFAASIRQEPGRVTAYGGGTAYGKDVSVPGDFSSAAYWIVAAGALPGGKLILRNVGLNPTRSGLLSVLSRMGVTLFETVEVSEPEPKGTIIIEEGSHLRSTNIGGKEIPNVIDELPIIAVAGALAEGNTIISDAGELRHKESDRLKVMARNLRQFNVPVEESNEGMTIVGGNPIKAARVSSQGDHRIAMACAILALFADGPSEILDTECVNTSYPAFPHHLREVLREGAVLSVTVPGFSIPFIGSGTQKKNPKNTYKEIPRG